jgi:hypothetical protein
MKSSGNGVANLKPLEHFTIEQPLTTVDVVYYIHVLYDVYRADGSSQTVFFTYLRTQDSRILFHLFPMRNP